MKTLIFSNSSSLSFCCCLKKCTTDCLCHTVLSQHSYSFNKYVFVCFFFTAALRMCLNVDIIKLSVVRFLTVLPLIRIESNNRCFHGGLISLRGFKGNNRFNQTGPNATMSIIWVFFLSPFRCHPFEADFPPKLDLNCVWLTTLNLWMISTRNVFIYPTKIYTNER